MLALHAKREGHTGGGPPWRRRDSGSTQSHPQRGSKPLFGYRPMSASSLDCFECSAGFWTGSDAPPALQFSDSVSAPRRCTRPTPGPVFHPRRWRGGAPRRESRCRRPCVSSPQHQTRYRRGGGTTRLITPGSLSPRTRRAMPSRGPAARPRQPITRETDAMIRPAIRGSRQTRRAAPPLDGRTGTRRQNGKKRVPAGARCGLRCDVPGQ